MSGRLSGKHFVCEIKSRGLSVFLVGLVVVIVLC